ncbi:MAG TPA: hypothetical protein VMU75_05550 [Acidimicrobiales bacterium]|nr:hypothetical protein [Acidimicrobiales bacterium]
MNGRGLAVDRRSLAGFAGYAAAVGVACSSSIRVAIGQSAVVPLPAVTLVAPLATVVALFTWRVPAATPQVQDPETDVILSVPPLLLGAWLVYWGPRKLGVQFYLFRPDLIGLFLVSVALASLLLGARFAAGAARSLALCALVCCPVVQLFIAGIGPGALRVAAASTLACLPLVAGLGRSWPRLAVLLVAGAATGGAAGALVASVTDSPAAAGFSAAVLACAGALVAHLSLAPTSPRVLVPLAVLRLRRVVVVALVAGAVGLLDTVVPALALAGPARPRPALDPRGRSQAESVRPGVAVRRWEVALPPAPSGHALVVTTTGPSVAATLTYPMDSLLAWPDAPCPTRDLLRSDGLDVTISLYSSAFTGYRWEELEWGWPTTAGYQRVDLVISSSPNGDGLVFPALRPEVVLDALRTSTDFVANRQVDCGVLPVPPSEAAATLQAFLAASRTR